MVDAHRGVRLSGRRLPAAAGSLRRACGCDLDPFTTFGPTRPASSLLGLETVGARSAFHLRFATDVPVPSTIDMWIDRFTYLPVYEKVAYRETVGDRLHAPPVGPTTTVTDAFTWLPRTGANLARFGIVIPPGFRPAAPGA